MMPFPNYILRRNKTGKREVKSPAIYIYGLSKGTHYRSRCVYSHLKYRKPSHWNKNIQLLFTIKVLPVILCLVEQ